MAKLDLILFPQIWSRKQIWSRNPQILSSLEIYILVFFPQISVGKLRSYAFWKFRFYSSTANFPRETPDLTLPGNLDLIPFWQNLNISQEFSPGKLRSDAFRDNQPCSVLFQSCFTLKQSCLRAVQGCFPLIQSWSKFVTFRSEIVKKNTN